MQTNEPNPPLHVLITREMFSIFYTLTLPDGSSEELEIEEMREWFRVRGANMDIAEEAFTQCWNFLRAEVEIHNPKQPPRPVLPYSPDI